MNKTNFLTLSSIIDRKINKTIEGVMLNDAKIEWSDAKQDSVTRNTTTTSYQHCSQHRTSWFNQNQAHVKNQVLVPIYEFNDRACS